MWALLYNAHLEIMSVTSGIKLNWMLDNCVVDFSAAKQSCMKRLFIIECSTKRLELLSWHFVESPT